MTRRLSVAWLLLGGCGFSVAGAPGDAAVGDDMPDGPTEDMTVTMDDGTTEPPGPGPCIDRWLSGNLTFSEPLGFNLGASTYDADPWLSADELTMYFVSTRSANTDIYRTTRASVTSAWATPVISELSDMTFNDSKAVLTADGLTAVFGASRPGSMGTDFYQATRASVNDPLGAASATPFGSINTSGQEFDAHVDPTGVRLYYAGVVSGLQVILTAERSNVMGAFGTPSQVANVTGDVSSVGMPVGAADPALSADERVIIYTTARAALDSNLWYATRADRTATFSTPQKVPMVNSDPYGDGGAHLSADGCTIYFESKRVDNVSRIYTSKLSI